jgi:hypothetical protein
VPRNEAIRIVFIHFEARHGDYLIVPTVRTLTAWEFAPHSANIELPHGYTPGRTAFRASREFAACER